MQGSAIGESFATERAVVVPPLPWKGAQAGRCYNNVLTMIQERGGEAAFGWLLCETGPLQLCGRRQPPLYRRWMNHVLWRDPSDNLWEVSPCEKNDPAAEFPFIAVTFLLDPAAKFEVQSDLDWITHPSRYEPLRPEGRPLTDFLVRAQNTYDPEERAGWLIKAFFALREAGYRPTEMRLDARSSRLNSVLCVVE